MNPRLFILLLGAIFMANACKKDTLIDSTTPTVAGLNCSSVVFAATATAGTAYTGSASLPYTSGNGQTYTAGSAIASSGVTGLSATLQAGTLASGSGSLTYNISGTPSGAGTASFAVSFGGQSCTLELTVSASSRSSDCSSATGLQKVVCLAEAFKATLNATQLAALQLSYSKSDAVKWSNLPQALTQTKRVGLAFSSLSATQLTAVKALLEAILGPGSNEGYSEAIGILAADDYLGANGGGSTYGSGNYYIAFLGSPSTTTLWELQYGGHHIAVSNTYNGGKLVGATPAFRSTEPFAAFTQNGATYEPMAQERSALAAMLTGLSETELSSAKLSSTMSDILLGPGKDGQFPTTRSGLKVSNLSSTKKALVLAAIKSYVGDLDEENAASIMAKYSAELDDTYIAYSGTTAMLTQNDYVRIDGPSVWIEYSTQGGIVIRSANHPHSVWRDRSTDYGGN